MALLAASCTELMWLGSFEPDSTSESDSTSEPDSTFEQRDGNIDSDGCCKDGDSDGPGMPARWVDVNGQTFSMGSPANESCRASTEDRHEVTISRSFEIQTTEVTQDQFQRLMGYNPAYFPQCGPDCPVESVNWYEAAAYCNALSQQSGLALCYDCSGGEAAVECTSNPAYVDRAIYTCPGYRLPTEAEWELAYRGGTQTPVYSGTFSLSSDACHNIFRCASHPSVDAIGWYCANSDGRTHPVGLKQANAYGLVDMAGNVLEWCHDYKTSDSLGVDPVRDPFGDSGVTQGSSHVVRGGGYAAKAKHLRAAQRFKTTPASRSSDRGFRCVRTQL